MDTDDEQDAEQAIESFATVVAYIWTINECIHENIFGDVGAHVEELGSCAKSTATYLGVGVLDIVLLGLSFFREYANSLDMRIMPYTETIVLIAAFM